MRDDPTGRFAAAGALSSGDIANRLFAKLAGFPLSKLLVREISSKVRRNGGMVIYDGIPLRFPTGVGSELLTNITWHGNDGYEAHHIGAFFANCSAVCTDIHRYRRQTLVCLSH